MNWTIMGTFPDQNNQVKVIAKRGSAVLHMGRLTPEAAAAVGQAELDAFWASGTSRPEPRVYAGP